MSSFKSQFISKKQLDNVLFSMKRTEIYKAFNLNKESLDEEIRFWSNPIKEKIQKDMEE